MQHLKPQARTPFSATNPKPASLTGSLASRIGYNLYFLFHVLCIHWELESPSCFLYLTLCPCSQPANLVDKQLPSVSVLVKASLWCGLQQRLRFALAVMHTYTDSLSAQLPRSDPEVDISTSPRSAPLCVCVCIHTHSWRQQRTLGVLLCHSSLLFNPGSLMEPGAFHFCFTWSKSPAELRVTVFS